MCAVRGDRRNTTLEVKINREIREYTESLFFGLSLRQLIFSILACGVAVGIYFGLRNLVGTETVSWMCILGAAPFAAIGFIKYHGMSAEQFIWAWVKSEFLMPKKLTFGAVNTYAVLLGSPQNYKFCGERRSDGAIELSRLRGSEKSKVRDDEKGGVPLD